MERVWVIIHLSTLQKGDKNTKAKNPVIPAGIAGIQCPRMGMGS